MKTTSKFSIKKVVLFVLILVIVAWIAQLFVCDLLTLKYASDIDACRECEECSYWIDDTFSAKVISRNRTETKIYYFNEDMGVLVTHDNLATEESTSLHIDLDTLWSASGNADRLVWPYWYHCFYFLF